MSAPAVLGRLLGLHRALASLAVPSLSQPRRNYWKPFPTGLPKPGVAGTCYRRIVHFKDEYTVEPLRVTNLAGRDPITG